MIWNLDNPTYTSTLCGYKANPPYNKFTENHCDLPLSYNDRRRSADEHCAGKSSTQKGLRPNKKGILISKPPPLGALSISRDLCQNLSQTHISFTDCRLPMLFQIIGVITKNKNKKLLTMHLCLSICVKPTLMFVTRFDVAYRSYYFLIHLLHSGQSLLHENRSSSSSHAHSSSTTTERRFLQFNPTPQNNIYCYKLRDKCMKKKQVSKKYEYKTEYKTIFSQRHWRYRGKEEEYLLTGTVTRKRKPPGLIIDPWSEHSAATLRHYHDRIIICCWLWLCLAFTELVAPLRFALFAGDLATSYRLNF
ncbi:hypothetical protein J6590_039956 [Homalodisca vitripennis]|nr:hypothetical protein J6590_039956 [Homalodisca vitripennis]